MNFKIIASIAAATAAVVGVSYCGIRKYRARAVVNQPTAPTSEQPTPTQPLDLTHVTLAEINTSERVKQVFDALYASITHTIEFRPEYHNGTGYLNGMTDLELPAGRTKMVDDSKRRIVHITNDNGDVDVFFERYCGDDRICAHIATRNGGVWVTPYRESDENDALGRMHAALLSTV